uniref:Zinc finger CCCH domain-containing protein 21 n=1 Tax=Cajanus cajan TaxID=3821 RepID=A0A151SXS3_CAJCA|nr:Putative zinc finger CCCH domain-containing protein 21 [Cajanus cajan]
MAKTELCRRFKKGACAHGSKCNYAHSTAELRRQPKFCRLFLQNKHCPYGRTCRYIHSTSATPFPGTTFLSSLNSILIIFLNPIYLSNYPYPFPPPCMLSIHLH